MFTALALTFLSAGSVTDPTPVDSAIVEMTIADPTVAAPVCDAYRGIVGTLAELGLDTDGTAMFVELIDAWSIVTLESDSLRLDNGVRDTLTDWLHTSCS